MQYLCSSLYIYNGSFYECLALLPGHRISAKRSFICALSIDLVTVIRLCEGIVNAAHRISLGSDDVIAIADYMRYVAPHELSSSIES